MVAPGRIGNCMCHHCPPPSVGTSADASADCLRLRRRRRRRRRRRPCRGFSSTDDFSIVSVGMMDDAHSWWWRLATTANALSCPVIVPPAKRKGFVVGRNNPPNNPCPVRLVHDRPRPRRAMRGGGGGGGPWFLNSARGWTGAILNPAHAQRQQQQQQLH
ncbi:hypothetical protein LY76DRAFT_163323 [Colletotrichum caudatum]|nr:hypothetical protein LY76DRAFT_163323 [Colletotrichum caudatum]